jgi:hypothetical protein
MSAEPQLATEDAPALESGPAIGVALTSDSSLTSDGSLAAEDRTAAAEAKIVDPWVDLRTDLVVDERFVKCWVETIPPGESRPAHIHRHPWVSVVLSGATGESYTHDGRLMGRGEAVTGTVRFNGPGVLPYGHFFKNVSQDRTLMMVAVEIRVPGGADAWAVPAPDAALPTGGDASDDTPGGNTSGGGNSRGDDR